MADKIFWNSFYHQLQGLDEPSNFAKFIGDSYSLDGILIELGCGNARDSRYFHAKGLTVIAVDQCEDMVAKLNRQYASNDLQFIAADFTSLDRETKCNQVYSRFTLHAVDEVEATRTMKWAYNVLSESGYFFIEVRSVNDELYGKGNKAGKDAWVLTHYRRFIRKTELVSELKDIGFKIVHQSEARGYAPLGNEDPMVIRVVAQK